jgi:hypothetical protein
MAALVTLANGDARIALNALELATHATEPDQAGARHLTLSTVEDAMQHCVTFYRNFHSIRYIEGRLVVRIQHRPSAELLDRLSEEFGDILVSGRIETCEPHRYEDDEPEVRSLHRLRMHFDQKHLGRLRCMIDVLNQSVTQDQAASQPAIKPIHGITPESSDENGDLDD